MPARRPGVRPRPRPTRRSMGSWIAPGRVLLLVEPLEDRSQASVSGPQLPLMAADPSVAVAAFATPALVAPTPVVPTATGADLPDLTHRLTSLDLGGSGAGSAPGGGAVTTTVAGPVVRHELVLIEPDVPERAALARGLLATPDGRAVLEVVQLAGGGAAEITDVLRRHPGGDAVALISHGADGALGLGSGWLDSNTIGAAAGDVAAWGAALNPGASILLYGCNVAADAAGQAFVTQLVALAGTTVAASTDLTGAAELGGNWALEYATGPIQSAATLAPGALAQWHGLLAAPTVTVLHTAATYTAGAAPITIDNTLGVGLSGGGQLTGATVAITTGFAGAEDVLGYDATVAASYGLTGSYDATTGALTFVGSALPAGYQALLRTVTYQDTSSQPSTAQRAVTFTVTAGTASGADSRPVAENRPPVANPDSYTTNENTPLTVTAPGVLGNDSDPDGDPLTVTSHTNLAHGTVTVNANGSFTVTPAAGFVGTDSATYTVSDGRGGTATTTLTITVNAVPGIVVTGNSFLVAADNSVYRIDALTGAVIDTYPTGLANDGAVFGPDGSLYVADYYGGKIDHYGPSGTLLGSFGARGTTPQGLAFGPDGNLYVTTTNSTVERYHPDGSNHTTFIAAGSGGLINAKGIAWGPDGNVYVSSYVTSEVLRYDGTTGAFLNVFATGPFLNWFGFGTGGFEDLTFGPDGNLYVASYGDGKVYRYRGADGAALGAFATGISTAYGLRFDPNGNLDVVSHSTGTILVFNGSTGAAAGTLATGLPNPSFLSTTDSLVTTSSGGTATFRVVLDSQPASAVTIALASSAPAQGTLSQKILVFNPSNWNVPQAVTVTGLNDGIANGDQAYWITGATFGDPAYAGLPFAPIPVLNRDVDLPPVATADGYTTAQNTPLTVAAPGVLGNDTDPDGDPLAVGGHTAPAHGTLTINTNGSFTYTPAAGYSGADSFTYTVSDGRGGTATGTVSLTVTPANPPPVAVNDTYTTAVNTPLVSTPLVVAAPGVLTNDSDPNGNAITAQLVSTVGHGVLTFNADGSFTYTAVLNFSGSDSFTYRVTDGTAWSNTAAVTINVSSPNRSPTASPDGYTTPQDTPLAVAAPGVLANDSDPDGDTISAVLDSQPAHGTLAFNRDGSFTYTPATGYTGADSFTYHATDGSLNSPPVVVSLSVTPVYHPPVAADDSATTPAGVAVTVPVLANDTDPNGSTLGVTGVTQAANGAVTTDGATVTYTPAAGFVGTDSFAYTVTDGYGQSATATVTVTVRPVPPTANPDAYSTAAGVTLTVPAASGVLANDTDPNGSALTAALTTQPAHGTTTVNPDGGFTYTPAAGFVGTDSFTYQVADQWGTSAPATVTLTVTPAASGPVGGGGTFDDQDVAVAYTVVAGHILVVPADPATHGSAAELLTGAEYGTVSMADDGSFSYAPDPGFVGTDHFLYRIGTGGSTAQLVAVTITVSPAPAAPPPAATGGNASGTVGSGGTGPSGERTPAGAPTTGSGPAPVSLGTSFPGPDRLPTTVTTSTDPVPVPPTSVRVVTDTGRIVAVNAIENAAPVPAVPVAEVKPLAPPAPATSPTPAVSAPVVAAPARAPAAPDAGGTPAVAAAEPVELEATAPVFAELDRTIGDILADTRAVAATDTLVVTGLTATAGYVLLNTRAAYWLITALLARPAFWRGFDPLDVIYAWEEEQKHGPSGPGPGDDRDESLQSMVG